MFFGARILNQQLGFYAGETKPEKVSERALIEFAKAIIKKSKAKRIVICLGHYALPDLCLSFWPSGNIYSEKAQITKWQGRPSEADLVASETLRDILSAGSHPLWKLLELAYRGSGTIFKFGWPHSEAMGG